MVDAKLEYVVFIQASIGIQGKRRKKRREKQYGPAKPPKIWSSKCAQVPLYMMIKRITCLEIWWKPDNA